MTPWLYDRIYGLIADALLRSSDLAMHADGTYYSPDPQAGSDDAVIVPNPSFWAKDFDLSCVSLWRDGYNCLGAGTLVTPQHFVAAYHFATGTKGLWLGTDGQIYERSYTKWMVVNAAGSGVAAHADGYNVTRGLTGGQQNDILVYELDSPLPASVKPAWSLPARFDNIMNGAEGLPLVTTNAARTLWNYNWYHDGNTSDGSFDVDPAKGGYHQKQAKVAEITAVYAAGLSTFEFAIRLTTCFRQ